MTARLIRFPVERTRKCKHARLETHLAQDPNYHFIRDLLQAVSNVGLELDKSPEAKARELYARYQRENPLAKRVADSD